MNDNCLLCGGPIPCTCILKAAYDAVYSSQPNSRSYPKTLTFAELQEASLKRSLLAYGHKLNDWTPTDWACAMAGEMGEACNDIKKLRRLTPNYDQTGKASEYYSAEQKRLARQAAIEVADTVLYAVLLCARLGYSLEDVIREKFNETSEKKGCDIKL